MSGFAAVWNTDGTTVNEVLLLRMQHFLASRGPDEQRYLVLGEQRNVGLVYAAFHTTPESTREHQPCTIDGVSWLVGHVRIDGRDQLSEDLRTRGISQRVDTDAHMILQAYRAWGSHLVDHIIGDYSFVIWNRREQRLLAVRDHLGTRPLFYTQVGKTIILSNTLDCVRLHSGVSAELDDIWIYNFLAHARRGDFEKTAYRAIKRLPPGHVLELRPMGGGLKKYWQVEVGEPIFYKRPEDYLEHFKHLAKLAIKDRIRSGRVGVGMSGGLDSTSIVALLLELVEDKSDIIVNSTYFEKLIDDDERQHAEAAADHLGISINFENLDEKVFDPQWSTRLAVTPEPSEGVLAKFAAIPPDTDPFSKIRVLFSGEGPDDALMYSDWKPYLRWLLKTGRVSEFASAVRCRARAKSLTERYSSLRAAFRSRMSDPEPPAWLRQDVVDPAISGRLQPHQSNTSARVHPWHPMALSGFHSPVWQDCFDAVDAGFGWRLIESVHPYLDIRMLQFLLSVPVIPWCHSKLLMRESMRGLLPEVVLARKKTTLSDDPWIKAMVRHPFPSIQQPSELSRYVDVSKIPSKWEKEVHQNRTTRRLLALQYWLVARDRRQPIVPNDYLGRVAPPPAVVPASDYVPGEVRAVTTSSPRTLGRS